MEVVGFGAVENTYAEGADSEINRSYGEYNVQNTDFINFCQSLRDPVNENQALHLHHRNHGHAVHYHRHPARGNMVQIVDPRLPKAPRQGGLIVEWPRPKLLLRPNKYLKKVMFWSAHTLYWLYKTNLLPTAIAIDAKQPPNLMLDSLTPLSLPARFCNIIEPEW